jgi:hypothetical protein
MHKYVFVLSLPYSGSTVLWRLLSTSPTASSHPVEGQTLPGVKQIVWERRWEPDHKLPWEDIKQKWEQAWDMTKPVLLEKSPPHIIRAFDIERVFLPAYFIVMIRDPYAFCEGVRRRDRVNVGSGAEFWARCATYQVRNIEGLKNVIYFKYEDFADDPASAKDQILDFIPELQHLDITASFDARSIKGRGHRIRNFNREKINRLCAKDIRDINTVLKQNDHLMTFYGYEYLEPSAGLSIKYFMTTGLPKTLKALSQASKVKVRLRNRRH